MKKLILFIFIIFICSCSTIKFYSADDNIQDAGIQFYYPKPYLLVTVSNNSSGGEQSINSQVIYLPDLSNPKYAVLKPGFGSSNLSIALSNGMLTAVGQQSDSKIPETITSIGGLASAVSGMLKIVDQNSLQSVNLYEISSGENGVFLQKIEFRE